MFNKKLKERVERLEKIHEHRCEERNRMTEQLVEITNTKSGYTNFNKELIQLLSTLNNKVKHQEEQIELLMTVCEPLIVKKTQESLETLANGLASAFDELASNVANVKQKASKKEKKIVDKSTSATTTKKKTTKKVEGK